MNQQLPTTMTNTNTRELVYLAGLLHDIGKFYQRADPDGAPRSKLLLPETKGLESDICPPDRYVKGKYSHKHVLWTAQFFDDPIFKARLAPTLNSPDFSYDSLIRLSAAHHNPRTDLERIIQKADHYSSGADRSKLEAAWKDSEEENDKAWDNFRRIKMRSVFEGVSLDKKYDQIRPTHKLPTTAITLSQKNYFPRKDDDSLPDYSALWAGFMGELKFVQARSFRVFADTLLALLEKYTSRIPASTQHLPDVSLFDHLKTTAAFGLCLHDYLAGRTALPKADEKPFVLIGGDISGIQKFIYSIIARGAAKNLKGRSFYLQLLVDNIVRYLLENLFTDTPLFDGNVVYASGGGFYILAPNLPELPDRLREIEQHIARQLFAYHKTDLYLCLDYVAFGETELFYKDLPGRKTIGEVWQELAEKLSRKKGQRFIGQMQGEHGYNTFFEKKNEGGDAEKDAITNEELGPDTKTIEGGRRVNRYTYQQIELGKVLKSTDYWLLATEPLTYFVQEPIDPIGLGYYNYFLPKEAVDAKNADLVKSADRVRVCYFNRDNFLEPIQKGVDNIYGFAFYGGNDYPSSSWHQSPKTFEEMCGVEFADDEKEQRKTGPLLTRLGVLRMDVDNLGRIFKDGFAPDKRSFSRYCTLSRSMDYFFKGYLNQLWKDDDAYRQFTQIIYAGGDDLFIVGKWDVLTRMANDINQRFRDWTCHNANFTLSGGMAIVGPKYPLLKSAALSETFEKAAKSHQFGHIEKDAFALFGYTDDQQNEVYFSLNWQAEYDYVFWLKDQLKTMLEPNAEGKTELARGFPSDMFNLMQQARFQLKKPSPADKSTWYYDLQNPQVIWLVAYSLKRDQTGKNESVQTFLNQWANNIMTGKVLEHGIPKLPKSRYHALQLLALAARWAALEIRSELPKSKSQA